MKTDEHAQGAVQGQGRLQREGGPRANQAPEQEHSPGGANLCPDSSEIGSASPAFPRRLSREGGRVPGFGAPCRDPADLQSCILIWHRAQAHSWQVCVQKGKRNAFLHVTVCASH